jgi:glutamate dehydrogenase/leucine dehydrogenase
MARPLPASSKSKDYRRLVGPAFDNHEFVIMLSDESSGLRAFVAIHNTNLGPALGGTRMLHYQDESDAIEDALSLSRAMSYKCALANLPYGGGKGVIIAGRGFKKGEALLAYGHLIEKLGGLFKTGTDVGISDEDVRLMASQTEHMLGVIVADRGDLSTAKVAALGVFHAMRAALMNLYGTTDFRDKKVAIKGVGKLGGELARLVSEEGAKVLIADIDSAVCEALKKHLPNTTILSVEDIQKQEVDIYAPCALGNEFTEGSVATLRCKSIVGGANNQLASKQVGDLIAERGILYAPDYVVNAGGLIYVADELELGGFKKERVLGRTNAIQTTLSEIFQRAKSENTPTHRIADIIAQERIWG